MRRIMSKIIRLQGVLQQWSRNKFANMDQQVASALKETQEIQNPINDKKLDEGLHEQNIQAQTNLNTTLTI